MISNIINKINEDIAAKTAAYTCLSGMRLLGLAEPVLRVASEEEVFPVIVDNSGEDTALFVDDDFPAGIYHRLLSKTYSVLPRKQQYGDQNIQMAEAELLLICWAFRQSVHTTADVLESLIYSSFDESIKAVQSNFDRHAVFNGEFSGVSFFLPEDVMLFSMKYRFRFPLQAKECLTIENFCNN
jgi:hypothetical protein